jgi:hypothetical protein
MFRLRLLVMLLSPIILLSLAACTRPDSGSVIPPAPQRQTILQLQGRVQQGPDAGLNLSGELRTTLDSNRYLQGLLIRESGSPVTVTGQIDNLAIHLSFDLGNSAALLGVGTLQHGIDQPQGTAGGLLTGPQPGDSGDWFARWTTITLPVPPTPAPPAPINDSASPTNLMVLVVLILVAAVLLSTLLMPRIAGKSLYSRKRGRSTVPFVKASAQTVEPERWPDEATLPLAQFATTYAHGDDHYDLSFTIEAARGEFLGECGVGISATRDRSGDAAAPAWLESLAAPETGRPHQAVTALEVWLFDKNDINTMTKVLRAAQGFYQAAQRSQRDRVSEVLVIRPDQKIVLETKALRLRAHVMSVEYQTDGTGSASVFKQVSLKLAVWIVGQSTV